MISGAFPADSKLQTADSFEDARSAGLSRYLKVVSPKDVPNYNQIQ